MNKSCCVYCLTNKLNNKKYIGFTSQNPKNRWGGGSRYKRTTHIGRAIEKYGWNSFKKEILFDCLTESEGKELEKELIAKYKTTDKRYGYNLSEGGEGTTGYHHTDEAKEIMRQKKLGSSGYWKGKKLSDEHKKKLSKSHIGKNSGVPRSEEVKRKISETHKLNCKNKKPVVRIDVCTNEILGYYDSALDASKIFNIKGGAVTKCCKHQAKTAGGYKWEYA